MATLSITSGPAQGQSIECNREVVIGREGDLVLEDEEVSRRHTAIRPGPNGIEIEDLGSLNGTFVDGEQISGVATMTSSAKLRIGQTHLELEVGPRDLPVADPQRTAVRDTPVVEVGEQTAIRDRPVIDVGDRTAVRDTPPLSPEPTPSATPIATPDATTVRPTVPPEPPSSTPIATPEATTVRPTVPAGSVPPPGGPAPAPASGAAAARRRGQGGRPGPPAAARILIPLVVIAIIVVVLLLTHVI